MVYNFKVSGKEMKETVVIETIGKTALQAMFVAKEEATRQNLKWDEIEYL